MAPSHAVVGLEDEFLRYRFLSRLPKSAVEGPGQLRIRSICPHALGPPLQEVAPRQSDFGNGTIVDEAKLAILDDTDVAVDGIGENDLRLGSSGTMPVGATSPTGGAYMRPRSPCAWHASLPEPLAGCRHPPARRTGPRRGACPQAPRHRAGGGYPRGPPTRRPPPGR
jgi:hypothetical protein